MRSPYTRRLTLTLSLAALVAVAFGATRPPAPGITYRLRVTSKLPTILSQMGGDAAGPLILAKVKAVGNRARFDFQTVPAGLGMDDYVLVLDSSRVMLVNAEQKTYTDGTSLLGGGGGLGMLSSFAGSNRRGGGGRGGAGGGGGMPAIDINGLVTDLEELDGDTLGGRQVRHYQLVAEMNVAVMGSMAPLRIVIEMWTAKLPYTIVNPFDLTGTVSPDDPAAKFTTKLIELRKKIEGTPLKTIMTTTISGLGNGALPPLEFVQTTAVTDIKEIDVDLKELQVPVGFTKKGG